MLACLCHSEGAMRTITHTLVAIGGLILGTLPIGAHHAFAAEFDSSKPVSVTGTVSKVAWLNPHARFFVDAKDSRGASTHWELVLGSPNVLIRQGWERTFLKQGDVVTVTGFLARGGSHLAAARIIRFADGRSAVFGSAGDGGPSR